MDGTTDISQRFAELIEHLKISKSAFAKILGTSTGRISNIVQGRNRPDSQLLAKISEVYPKIELSWLLNGNGSIERNMSIHGNQEQTNLSYDRGKQGGIAGQNTQVTHRSNTQVDTQVRDVNPNLDLESTSSERASQVGFDAEVASKAAEMMRLSREYTVRLNQYQRELTFQLRTERPDLLQLKHKLDAIPNLIEVTHEAIDEYLSIQYVPPVEGKGLRMNQPDDLKGYDEFKAGAVDALQKRLSIAEPLQAFSDAMTVFLRALKPLDTEDIIFDYLLED